ncbi:MAG: bifunctional DNA-binding transcriptional regulator/O6-methylguanine-DNA methyltransferase Ada [Acidobacteriaceae bacterium]|nr:bifunctional DNA-binding transcriptional regulator/O6-methylguanine-DNA methyltransferase Ada [Acidobacteriaceae bacterium]
MSKPLWWKLKAEITMTNAIANAGTNGDEMWRAILARDRRADGLMFYAVKTTGIYCKPSCPSRRPRRASVEFFRDACSAEQAGYRACRRCRPNEANSEQQLIEDACDLMARRSGEQTSLEQLARQLGRSAFHFQRTFKQALGVSPREFQEARRFEAFKREVARGVSITDSLYAAGFGSSRALYETANGRLGMAPRQYAQAGVGTAICYSTFSTPLGTALLAATTIGVCSLRFGNNADELEAELRSEFKRAVLTRDNAALACYREKVLRFIEGPIRDLELPLDIKATVFQHRVWTAIRDIPIGETRTSKQLAKAIGKPAAARAVASACAANPVALAIPCHRVVRSGGDLAGYRWGLDRKTALLKSEVSTRSPERE